MVRSCNVPCLTESEIVLGAHCIIDGANSLHKEGFVHGQIRPDNMLVHRDKNGNVYAVLKGLHYCHPDGQPNAISDSIKDLTEKHRGFYVPPEILLGGSATMAGDIWSLGITLYVLVCGKFPFLDYHQIMNASLKWPKSVPLSKEFKNLVSSMLRVDPAKRPTAQTLLQHPWLQQKHASGQD